MDGWMAGWVGGWLENQFLKKTPSPKFGLESQLVTFDFRVCQYQLCHDIKTNNNMFKVMYKKKVYGNGNAHLKMCVCSSATEQLQKPLKW